MTAFARAVERAATHRGNRETLPAVGSDGAETGVGDGPVGPGGDVNRSGEGVDTRRDAGLRGENLIRADGGERSLDGAPVLHQKRLRLRSGHAGREVFDTEDVVGDGRHHDVTPGGGDEVNLGGLKRGGHRDQREERYELAHSLREKREGVKLCRDSA